MSILIWFLILLLIVFVILGIALTVVFVRLGRDLKQLGDDTETMVAKAGRMVRTAQVVVPAITLAKQLGQTMIKKYQSARSGEVDNDKATRKK